MCGIIGYLAKNTPPRETDLALKKLLHRGPDSHDCFTTTTDTHCVYLGHTRLSIIDLDSRSSQPMHYQGRYTVIHNGEIYNYLELRNELCAQGYRFDTQSDTEVIMAAYDLFGESCVEHFNGMWAFALYDAQKEELFCSRDRFGVKPFYYFLRGEEFAFTSEIKALLPLLGECKANFSAMIPYIARGFSDFGEETFFRGIKRLEASYNLVFKLKSNKLFLKKYYEIPKISKVYDSGELFKLLEESISLRLRSDVKVGACLSGGLDSSGIVALASRMQGGLEAIHAKSSLSENDESAYARHVADFLGIKLHIIEPSFKDFKACVDEVFYTQDEPFGSSSIFMQYFVMKKAKELGIKVLLDGQGADEVFLGYEHYLKFIYKDLRDRGICTQEEFFNELKLFRYDKAGILEGLRGVDDPLLAWDIITQKGNFNPKYLNKDALLPMLGFRDMSSFNIREIFSNNLPALLRFEDRDSMHFGVETRLPYLDYRLLELVINYPTQSKFQKGYLKYTLREAFDKNGLLPKEIIWRYNKMGFESPQKLWIDSYREEMLEEIHESKILKELFVRMDIRRDDFLWKLFSIAKWEQIFNVKI